VNPELASLASTAATTVVQLLTTDGWERLKSALGPLWGKSRPGREATLDAQLDDSRAEVIAAGDDAEQVRAELTAEWQGRLRRLLAADPVLAAELRRVLDEELSPVLRDLQGANPDRPDIRMRADVSGHGRAYQAGHDMTITER
jgi:hypothetical protein